MATSHITIDEGTTTQLATNDISEDAATKKLARSVLNKSDGTETGVAAQPLQVSLANTAANSTAVKVDGSGVTQPVSGSVTATVASTTITGTVASTQSGTWNVTNVSGTVSLPTGAATAAKQPALGTAGSASTDVITIQGIASGTVVPISVASIPSHAVTNAGTFAVQATQAGTWNVNVAASDISPATQNITAQDIASTSTAMANSQNFVTGAATANSTASFTLTGVETSRIEVTGTWTGTLAVEVSPDNGTTWVSSGLHQNGTNYTTSSFTNNFIGGLNTSGFTNIRVRSTASWTGTATIRVVESINSSSIYLANTPSLADGTTPTTKIAIKAASTAALSTDTALVVAQSPNSAPPTTADKTGSGSIGSLNATIAATTNGCSIVSFNIAGTWAATLLIEGTIDGGSTWITIDGDVDATDTLINSTTVNGLVTVNCASYGQVRLRANPYTSGTATVTWSANVGLSLIEVFNTNATSLKTLSTSEGATGSTIPANASFQGNQSSTSLPSATTAGNLVANFSDKYGRQVVIPGTIRDLVGTQTTTVSASTSETTIVTAASSVFNDLTALVISNTSATATRLDFRDTTAGSVLFSMYIPAGDVRGATFTRPIPQTSVNTNWTAQSSASVTDLRIYAIYDKNR